MMAPLVVLEFLSLSFFEPFWSVVAQVSVARRRLFSVIVHVRWE